MKLEHVAMVDKGFVEKSIRVETLPNGNYQVTALAKPTGNKKEQIVSMEFTQNGLNALAGSLLMFAD